MLFCCGPTAVAVVTLGHIRLQRQPTSLATRHRALAHSQAITGQVANSGGLAHMIVIPRTILERAIKQSDCAKYQFWSPIILLQTQDVARTLLTMICLCPPHLPLPLYTEQSPLPHQNQSLTFEGIFSSRLEFTTISSLVHDPGL